MIAPLRHPLLAGVASGHGRSAFGRPAPVEEPASTRQ
jgi:hypothetical protein